MAASVKESVRQVTVAPESASMLGNPRNSDEMRTLYEEMIGSKASVVAEVLANP